MEYKLSRTGYPDTTIRVMHSNAIENYSFALLGTVTNATVDPNQWVINKSTVTKDVTLGLPENYANMPEINILPNPNNGVFFINASLNGNYAVEVLDVQGRMIKQTTVSDHTKIDISKEASGVYSVIVKDGNGLQLKSAKLIKE
jgi:hypothetical protein